MEIYNQILDELLKFKGKHGLYIIRPKDKSVLENICKKMNYDFKSEIAYIGKGAKTENSDLRKRSKQEMGWSNFEGATFVKKIGKYLDFDIKDKTNKLLQEETKKFICSNFTIECIEFGYDIDLLVKENEFITKFQPCLNDKKNSNNIFEKMVKHQSVELAWINNGEIINPKTLVLGSFNPFENKTKSVDYYYGRYKNHFWRSIAIILDKDEEYFFDNQKGFERKNEIMQNRFICFDVIDSINFKSVNQSLLDDYLKNEIFSNYSDQKIWTSITKYKNNDSIQIIRNYNQSIIDFLNSNNSIKKVIHTMGVNRISEESTNPKEAKLLDSGFNGFIKKVRKICKQKNIDFILESYSPSDYAVKNGKTKKDDLILWLKNYLWLNE
jgi:hypothetical protein